MGSLCIRKRVHLVVCLIFSLLLQTHFFPCGGVERRRHFCRICSPEFPRQDTRPLFIYIVVYGTSKRFPSEIRLLITLKSFPHSQSLLERRSGNVNCISPVTLKGPLTNQRPAILAPPASFKLQVTNTFSVASYAVMWTELPFQTVNRNGIETIRIAIGLPESVEHKEFDEATGQYCGETVFKIIARRTICHGIALLLAAPMILKMEEVWSERV